MATEKTTVSYRRNRDYSHHFVWSYEHNRDLYNCYVTARNNPSKGYMNMLKIYWDELYPEIKNFNAKQLQQEATFIEKKNLHLTETNNRNETPRDATTEVSHSKTKDRSQPTE